MIRCHVCGKPLPDNARVCDGCRTPGPFRPTSGNQPAPGPRQPGYGANNRSGPAYPPGSSGGAPMNRGEGVQIGSYVQGANAQNPYLGENRTPPAPNGPPKKKNKKPWIVVAAMAAALVLVAGGVVVYLLMGSSVYAQARNGDYSAVADAIAQDQTLCQDEKLTEALLDRLSRIHGDCAEGSLSWEEARQELQTIEELGVDNVAQSVQTELAFTEALRQSGERCQAGEAAFQKGDYAAAIEAFQAVVPEYSGYEEAQSSLSASRENYRSQAKTAAEEAMALGNYGQARTGLVEALALLGEDEELNSLLDQCEQQIHASPEAEALAEAEASAANGDYATAISTLRQAIARWNETSELVRALEAYTAAYEAFTLQQVDSLLQEDEGAATVLLSEALQVLPESQALQAKQQALVGAAGGVIAVCPEPKVGDPLDVHGVDHTHQTYYLLGGEKEGNYNLTFTLDAGATTLPLVLVAGRGCAADSSSTVSVYLDHGLTAAPVSVGAADEAISLPVQVDGEKSLLVSVHTEPNARLLLIVPEGLS